MLQLTKNGQIMLYTLDCYDRILLSPIGLIGPTGPSVVQGPTYRPPSLIYSSLNLLFSLHTLI